MSLHSPGVARKCFFVWLLFSLVANFTWAQSEAATVSGQVLDPSGLNISGAQVKLVDIDRDTSTIAVTNSSGLYTFPSVRPGRYRMQVTAVGFKVVNVTGITANVQDHLDQNFTLVVGSASESVTVEGGAALVDTESAAVSTVVDRNFAENLPMNGRSFQTLIELTPGVVLVPGSGGYDSGQFSISGQRAASNYWMVDGVSANIGIGTFGQPGNGFSGALGAFGVQGGTNSLVSVDALQEFRIQTSTYAPEFGRTPGGQISIVTRSGTNQFHGTAFDYFRNDILDAKDWFDGYTNNPPLPKAEERQNDFGGTFGGPIWKNRSFFFFSYEGLRLRLPETALTTVPDVAARVNAEPAVQPFLKAFPLPAVGATDVGAGFAPFNASFSNRSTLDAYSLRVDDALTGKIGLWGRYNYSPSSLLQRGVGSLSELADSKITVQTATVGATWNTSANIVNDLRFNYSKTDSSSRNYLDEFGGAVLPPVSSQLPAHFTIGDSSFQFGFLTGFNMTYADGRIATNLQHQMNIVNTISVQKGSHALKFGIDFRRLSPVTRPRIYTQASYFADVASAEGGDLALAILGASVSSTMLFRNLGVYAQDTWRIHNRLTLTYGLRWDIDFAPMPLNGPSLNAVTGFDLSDLAGLALAPAGTQIFSTRCGNIAPRVGLAYEAHQSGGRSLVVRGGVGLFYDMATSEVGNVISTPTYPFGAESLQFGGTFPLSNPAAPTITPSELQSPFGGLASFDPQLNLPYTLEWNVAAEQALGTNQTISASYVGAAGKRLLQTGTVFAPNENISAASLVTNTATSDYDALQLQFQRRLSRGLQALASFSWAHSIDTASAGSIGNGANALSPSALNLNRGPSDFDLRDAFSAAATYDMPALTSNGFKRLIVTGWSIQNSIQAHSAPPVNVYNSNYNNISSFLAQVRPDVAVGLPLYLYGSQFPGGKAINGTPGAVTGGCPDGSQSVGPFCPPRINPQTGLPSGQGDLGRNALRGFGAVQWDFAVHRNFPLRESLNLQFRAEMFNVLNHPNFGAPVTDLSQSDFGLSTQMLGQNLNTNPGGGSLSPMYQIGGPRSIQFALKFQF
jgi:hypothetical protein